MKRKVAKPLAKKHAVYSFQGEVSDDPKLYFVVLRRDWKRFTAHERAALRPVIEEKMADCKANPSKYTAIKEDGPSWSTLMSKLELTRPAVMLTTSIKGEDFESPETVDSFDEASSMPSSAKKVVTKVREGSLDERLVSKITEDDLEGVKRLLAKGANPRASWEADGMPAISLAATCGDLEILKLLVKYGEDIDTTDLNLGLTPLRFAKNELRLEQDNPAKYQKVIDYLQSIGGH